MSRKQPVLAQLDATSGARMFSYAGHRYTFPYGFSLPLKDSLDGPYITIEELEQLERSAKVEIMSRAVKTA